MKKIIIILILFFLPLPAFAYYEIADIIAKVEGFEVHSLTTNCSTPQPKQDTYYDLQGAFCGPDAVTQAINAIGSGYIRRNLSLAPNLSGYVYKKVSSNTTTSYCDSALNPGTNIQTSYTEEHYIYSVFCVPCSNCDLPLEQCYTVIGAASCSTTSVSGNIIGFEAAICDCETGERSGATEICGDVDLYSGIKNGSITTGLYVIYTSQGCNLTQEEWTDLCASFSSSATCEGETDTDGDGVPDQNDYCETPPEEIANVDEIGCTKQGGGDDDGDGVPNELDKCVTPPGVVVDAFGCQAETDTETDTDGDGVPDYADTCPNQPGNDVDGCQIDNPQTDTDGDGIPDYLDDDVDGDGIPNGQDTDYNGSGGDGDNDNALLQGVINWLKAVNSGIKDVNGNIQGLGGKIDGLGNQMETLTGQVQSVDDNITDLKEKFEEFTDTDGVSTDLPDDAEFDGELPSDFEAIDLEQDFLSDIYDSFIQNNEFINQISGSSLTSSGSCSISSSVSILGRSVSLEFSLCDYDLTVWRAMCLMISSLTGFFIVFRKN